MAYGAIGGFSGGLFSGAASMFQLYGMYQDYQNTEANNKIADDTQMARAQDRANANVGQSQYSPTIAGTPGAPAFDGASMGDGISGSPSDGAGTKEVQGPPDPNANTKPVDTSNLNREQKSGLELAQKLIGGGSRNAAQGDPYAPSPETRATGATNPLAVPNANAGPALTPEQRAGKAPLPTFRTPPVAFDPSQDPNSAMARGELPQPQGVAYSPTTMPTYDIPPGGYQPKPSPLQAAPGLAGQQPPVAGSVAPQPGDMGRVTNRPVGAALSDLVHGTQTPETPLRYPGAAPTQAGAPAPSPVGAAPIPGAPPGAPAPAPQASAGPPPSWAEQALAHLNPIGSAQAAEPGLPPAQRDEGASPTVGGPPITATTPAEPGTAAPGSKSQAGPVAVEGKPGVVQSESTPVVVAPAVWHAPYVELQRQRPDLSAKIDAVAAKYGVDPHEIAAHWWIESDLKEHVAPDPTGKNKARGPMQIEPDTKTGLDPQNTRNIDNFDDNLDLGAQRIRQANADYGKNTPASFVAYMRSEKDVREQWAIDLPTALKNNPIVAKDLARAFPGVTLTQDMFPKGGPVSAHAVVAAAATGGPIAFLQAMVKTGPQPMGMTDLWRNVEDQMIHLALRKGDLQGAYHAQDYVFQMSHAGMLSNMMAGDQALLAGNIPAAAKYLAQAHAFFPDQTFGQFGIGRDDGKLYGQQFDEGSGKPMGKPFEITHDQLAFQMINAHDPKEYAKMVQEAQLNNSRVMLNQGRSEYYSSMPDVRREAAEQKAQTAADQQANQLLIAQGHDQARLDAELLRRETRAGNTQAADRAIDTGATKAYGPDSQDTMFVDPASGKGYPPARRQEIAEQAGAIYSDVRRTSRDAGSPVGDLPAQGITRSLLDHTATVKRGRDGTNAVVDGKTGEPLGFISDGLANRLGLRGAKPQAMNGPPISPVGAGANSQLAAMQGLGTNLSGQPIQPQQA